MNDLLLQYKKETGLNPKLSCEQINALHPAKIHNAGEVLADFTANLQNEFYMECGYFDIPSPSYVHWLENKLKELQK